MTTQSRTAPLKKRRYRVVLLDLWRTLARATYPEPIANLMKILGLMISTSLWHAFMRVKEDEAVSRLRSILNVQDADFSDSELRDICGPNLQCWFSRSGPRFDPATIGPYHEDTHVYICGPQRLLDAVQSALSAWPEDQVHGEVFQMTVDEDFKPEPFEATVASTGQRFLVPADKSLLDVLRDNDFAMPSSCEMGVCGSCECGYRDGLVLPASGCPSCARRPPSGGTRGCCLCARRGAGLRRGLAGVRTRLTR
jgi:ferredoxin